MITTLILPACGVKGIYYAGAYKSLLKHNVIKRENLKHILCCSSGCLFGLLINLNYSIEFIVKIITLIDFEKCIDYQDISDLFSDNGLFKINKLINLFEHLLNSKSLNKKTTMKQLYEHTKIEYVIKVYNYTDNCEEYISYKNNPDISVLKAISMSCCIPLFFKPIKYKGKYYIDGGINSGDAYIDDEKYKNYIRIKISKKSKKYEMNDNLFEYINNLFTISNKKSKNDLKNTIVIDCIKNLHFANFKISEKDKQEMIKHAQLLTDIYIYKYL